MYKNKLITRTNKINEYIKRHSLPQSMKLLPVITSVFAYLEFRL